ncbi:MAG: hypothetical protein PUP90_13405 [Nostoc sp. S4]|nr:hypothetical protein [Nostoc sp. S4]
MAAKLGGGKSLKRIHKTWIHKNKSVDVCAALGRVRQRLALLILVDG